MATEFIMPKLGLTMEEGTILEWMVDDGDVVDQGTAVLRIETDKTETEVEASGSGRIHTIGKVGEKFACGVQIGWFLDGDEEAPEATVTSSPAAQSSPTPTSSTPALPTATSTVAATTPGGRIVASPKARRLATERNIDLQLIRGTGPGGRIVSEDLADVAVGQRRVPAASGAQLAMVPRPIMAGGHTAPATAAARQLADLLGVDLATVGVDPTDGRVTRETVAAHVRGLLAASAAAPTVTPSPLSQSTGLAPSTQEPTSVTPLTGMRGTIAKRMHESLQAMAQLTLFMDADLDAVVADREARKTEGSAPGYTDYIIAAVARALVQHPHVNSQIIDEGVALLGTPHVGMAVALDGGLIVPVIRDTGSLDLAALSVESTRLAEAARSGSLAFGDLEGGTFSVSTLGMYGVDGFTPVINPPNTAILGVGRLRDDIVVDDAGVVSTTKRLTLSLTWDHRAFDGAPAAAFCRTIAELLQEPTVLDASAT